MHPQSIKARSLPYRPVSAKQRVCGRCGITQQTYSPDGDYYCKPCTPHAISLGWVEPGHGTYVCARCGETKRGNGSRKLCGGCNWNTGKGRNR